MKVRNNIEKETRKVFHEIHTARFSLPDKNNERLVRGINSEFLKLPPDFLKGKVCADLGCGSALRCTTDLLEMGAGKVHAIDLDESILEPGNKILGSNPDYQDRYELNLGSLLDLPYDDNFFDFVICNGVVHHTTDDRKSLDELFRVLKPGGKAFIMVYGSGGLLTRFVMETLRDEYKDSSSLRTFLNEELDEEWLQKQIDYLIDNLEDDGTKYYKANKKLLECLKILVDEDFILTLKDRICAPIYEMYTEEQFIEMLTETGFTSHYRVSKKPHYFNIRGIFAELYKDYDHPLAKLLYGHGLINIVATK
jgi:ubiquinone/menaquinone biosynthesis C-methylase UbiE